jgi:adenosylcobinamide-GDP ribazoletransferase
MPGASLRTTIAAVSFLTRVPVGRAATIDASDVARSTVLFPLVGAGIGAASAGVAVLLYPSLPAFLAAAIAVATAVLLTGAMHVDALGDTFDAAGARTRERALEIMRDPRLGTFGTAAIVFDCLIKVAAVAVLLDRGGAPAALVAAGALSRAASAPLAAVLPYARAEGGPGSVLTGRVGAVGATGTVLVGIALAVAVAGASGAIAAGAVAIVVVVTGLVYARWLGGATGDTLGATTEVGETVALVVSAALA